jgi:PiT family inorganic phosphate transporter
LLALGLALSFEFVNGFHDTANAVATVIYTHTLRPTLAVVWSGCWNLIGVLTSTGAIAFSVVGLLPVELVINAGSGPGFAMVFALLISAMIWNFGTWYLGLPASSSHTLVGSIIGVGLGHSMMTPGRGFGSGVNWDQAKDVGLSLLISPIIGFTCAALLLLLAKALIKRPELYQEPNPKKAPPAGVRALLMLTCTGVSFAHGSNDGQKGMGLIMLILIGILPGTYALNVNLETREIRRLEGASRQAGEIFDRQRAAIRIPADLARTELSLFLQTRAGAPGRVAASLAAINAGIGGALAGKRRVSEIPAEQRRGLRSDVYLAWEATGRMSFIAADQKVMQDYRTGLQTMTRYIPAWVKFAVALSLGLGTMIGWKRIVVTVGEKIGKGHLTYAQGAVAELVAMATIGISDHFGMPVSTTHVLSSGIAGTMAANRSGLQTKTLRNLLWAWVLTLPACVALGATTFALGLYFVLNVFGLQ